MREDASDDDALWTEGRPLAIGSTWMCESVNHMGGQKSTDFWEFLSKRDLQMEYEALVKALRDVPGSWHGGYKGSALSRKMLLDGHDAAFETKHTKLTLLKNKGHISWSEFRLCITDTDTEVPVEEESLPFKVYGQGFKVITTCAGTVKRFKAGGAMQALSGLDTHLPKELNVEVLRMLMKKNAMALHEQLSESLSLGPVRGMQTWEGWVTVVTKAYQERFARIGLRVEFNLKRSSCCCGDKCQSMCFHTHYWLEYVDPDLYPTYQSADRNDEYSLAMNYVRCSSPDSKIRSLLTSAGISFKRDVAVSKATGCAAVENASPRKKPDDQGDCKCNYEMSVYCGSQRAASRKFHAKNSVVAACSDPYCSKEACPNQI